MPPPMLRLYLTRHKLPSNFLRTSRRRARNGSNGQICQHALSRLRPFLHMPPRHTISPPQKILYLGRSPLKCTMLGKPTFLSSADSSREACAASYYHVYCKLYPLRYLVIRGLSSSLAPISADTNTRITFSFGHHTFVIPCLRPLLSALHLRSTHT